MHNLISSLDNIKGNPQQAKLQRLEFHAYGTKKYLIDSSLPMWSDFTLHQSIYLSWLLEPNLDKKTRVITYMYSFPAQCNIFSWSFFYIKFPIYRPYIPLIKLLVSIASSIIPHLRPCKLLALHNSALTLFTIIISIWPMQNESHLRGLTLKAPLARLVRHGSFF